MKILFLGLASTFTPGMKYQDNCFCDALLNMNYEVVYIGNPEEFENGTIVKSRELFTVLENGLRLYRTPYNETLGYRIGKRLRTFVGVSDIIETERPDVIFCHGVYYYPIIDVVRYKKKHPEIKVYADTHASYKNSGKNWLSRLVLYKFYYRYLYKRVERYLEAFFFIGTEEKQFAIDMLHARDDLLYFLPLGGFPYDDKDYERIRSVIRKRLKIDDSEILLIHSGKLDRDKKTDSLLNAFFKVKHFNGKLLLIGSISAEMEEKINSLIKRDDRVSYIGWMTATQLTEYLCACDLYCQPGSESATLQNAICCKCAVMSYPHSNYISYYDYGNIKWVSSETEIEEFLRLVSNNKAILDEMSSISAGFAEQYLDYNNMVKQFLPKEEAI